jgi:hypothetical protein
MPTRQMARIGRVALLLGGVAISAACSDDSGGPSSPLVVAQTEENSGDIQFGVVSEPLDEVLRVIVTRDGQPVEDVEVQWLTTSGGSFTPGTSLTGPDGIATTSWILGPTEGEQSASARVVGAEGSPVIFTAQAADPPPGGGGGGPIEPIRRPIIR